MSKTTDENGIILFGHLLSGDYYLIEKKAPAEYIINGETGRIHGTYPYSWVKITILIILGIIVIYFIFVYFNS